MTKSAKSVPNARNMASTGPAVKAWINVVTEGIWKKAVTMVVKSSCVPTMPYTFRINFMRSSTEQEATCEP